MELNILINRNKKIFTRINCNKFILFLIVKNRELLYTVSMSVRKIKKSYISCTGYFSSYKKQQHIAYESVLERDFYMLLEFNKDVLSYHEQPFRIYYDLFGKRTRYTPDVLVTYNDGSQKVFEIKYQKEIDTKEGLKEKLSLLESVIPEQKSLPFEVFTDQVTEPTYLDNAQFLYKYAFTPEDGIKTQKIREVINSSPRGITVQNLLEQISLQKSVHLHYIPYIWREVFHNTHLIDTNRKLTMSTLLQGEIL